MKIYKGTNLITLKQHISNHSHRTTFIVHYIYCAYKMHPYFMAINQNRKKIICHLFINTTSAEPLSISQYLEIKVKQDGLKYT